MNSHRTKTRRGFTLVELMVVIVILGGLIAIVGTNVFKALSESDQSRAKTQMSAFKTSIDMYIFTHRKVPSSLDTLLEEDPKTGEAYMEDIPDDPWGNPYALKPLGGRKYQIISYGQDGQEGTEDDIKWPEESDD
ncbi:MAG: type II secretion system protein GspG [Planctomycetota bacterium]|jgi:general secretion pathway protein G